MANPPDIPGYYWDSVKGKYFKIPKSGSLPANHAHSAEALRQLKEEADEAASKRRAVELSKNRIKRVEHKLPPLFRYKINPELGGPRKMADAHSFYLSQFQYIPLHGRSGRVNFRIPFDPNRLPRPFPVLHASAISGYSTFDVSMKHSTLLWSSDEHQHLASMTLASELDTRANVMDNDRADLRHPQNVCACDDHLGSIDVHHPTGIVMTTWEDAGRGHNVWLATLEGRQLFRPGMNTRTRVEDGAGTQEPKYNINAVSVGKAANQFAFMLGGNFNRIVAIDKDNGGNTFHNFSQGCFSNPMNEVFAVEMLEDDPFLYVVGQRSGKLKVFDVRTSTRQETIRGKHISSICKVKDMGNRKFVVSGLQSTMSVYDIRFMKGARYGTNSMSKVPNNPPLTARMPLKVDEPYTLPITWMAEHQNKHYRKADVAVDRATGLIAAAQHDEKTNMIKFFDMATGDFVAENNVGPEAHHKYVSNQIRWVDDGEKGDNGLKALWFSKGPVIYSGRWDNRGDMCDEV